MPKKIHNIVLDINKHNGNIQFESKQYEDIELNITLLNNRQAFDVSNCNVDFYCNKSLNSTCNVVNGKVQVVIESESVIETGIYKAELSIADGDGELKTPTFHFVIKKSLSGEIIISVKTLLDSEGYTIKDSDGNLLKVRG